MDDCTVIVAFLDFQPAPPAPAGAAPSPTPNPPPLAAPQLRASLPGSPLHRAPVQPAHGAAATVTAAAAHAGAAAGGKAAGGGPTPNPIPHPEALGSRRRSLPGALPGHAPTLVENPSPGAPGARRASLPGQSAAALAAAVGAGHGPPRKTGEAAPAPWAPAKTRRPR